LALEDGTVFRGVSIGAAGTSTGEVVFNTAMTGYQEILTDPSYSRQIVTLTYPHIGNTGTNPDDHESNLVHAAGLVIRDLPLLHSSRRATESLPEFLRRRSTVAIAEIDTRKLTRILREKGAQAGCIASGDAALRPDLAIEAARRFPGLRAWTWRRSSAPTGPTSGTKARTGRWSRGRAAAPASACTWSPTISVSSATSCACWPTTVAA